MIGTEAFEPLVQRGYNAYCVGFSGINECNRDLSLTTVAECLSRCDAARLATANTVDTAGSTPDASVFLRKIFLVFEQLDDVVNE